MFAILPILCLVLVFLLFSLKRPLLAAGQANAFTDDWRSAALTASVVVSTYAVLVTYLLSAFDLLTPLNIGISWALALVAGRVVLWKLRENGWQLGFGLSKLPSFSYELVALVIGLAAMMCMIALVAPPNNWDSQVYHMPRIMHWLQERSIAYYPTHCPRQNHQNMGAEYLIMQFQALNNGDRFANFPHWLAYAGSILAVSLIAKLLGSGARGQVLAAVFAATGPMALLQSTSTQSDMLSAFWTIVFIYYAIRWLIERNTSIWLFTLIGASLGLATLTKSTTYTMALPFLIWITIGFFLYLRWKFWRPILIITIAFMALTLPMYVHNAKLYEHPLGPRTEGGNGTGDFSYTNAVMSPGIFVSNYVRNLTIHASIFPINAPHLQLKKNMNDPAEISPLKRLQDSIEGRVKGLHKVVGANPDDQRTSWGGCVYAICPVIFNDENDGDPVQMALLLILSPIFLGAVLVFICVKRLRPYTPWNALILWIAAQAAFVLFALILRWQPWHSRLHIAFFLMFAPVVGFALDWLPQRRSMRWMLVALGNAAAVILMASGFLWGASNMQRSLWGGANIFKVSRDDLQVSCIAGAAESFRQMAGFMKEKSLKDIGLSQCGEPMEYCYWAFLRKYMSQDFRMRDIFISGPGLIPETVITGLDKTDPREAARLRKQNVYLQRVVENYKKLADKPPFGDFKPDAIVLAKIPGAGYLPIGPDGLVKYKDQSFRLAWTSPQHDVYMPAEKMKADEKPVQFPVPTPTPAPTPAATPAP